jgi:hypothetical protein
LTGTPIVAISGAAEFEIFTQPVSTTITGESSQTFVVRFSPIAIATYTATISIANDDSDEDPYTFLVQGQGAAFSDDYIV